jgi:hypothetical protein
MEHRALDTSDAFCPAAGLELLYGCAMPKVQVLHFLDFFSSSLPPSIVSHSVLFLLEIIFLIA